MMNYQTTVAESLDILRDLVDTSRRTTGRISQKAEDKALEIIDSLAMRASIAFIDDEKEDAEAELSFADEERDKLLDEREKAVRLMAEVIAAHTLDHRSRFRDAMEAMADFAIQYTGIVDDEPQEGAERP